MSRPTTPAGYTIFGDAHLFATAHLSNEQRGMMLSLLLIAWRQPSCSLPDDENTLARIAGVGVKKWRLVASDILELWDLEDGRWTYASQLRERAYVSEASERARSAAKARWHGPVDESAPELDLGTDAESHAQVGPDGPQKVTGRSCENCGKPLKTPDLADATADALRARGICICIAPPSSIQGKKNGGDARARTREPPRRHGDPHKVIGAWNRMAEKAGLPQMAKLTEKRRTALHARIADYGEAKMLQAIDKVPDRPKLLGAMESGWKATFDFFLRPNTVTRILEGDFKGSANGKGTGTAGLRDPLYRHYAGGGDPGLGEPP